MNLFISFLIRPNKSTFYSISSLTDSDLHGCHGYAEGWVKTTSFSLTHAVLGIKTTDGRKCVKSGYKINFSPFTFNINVTDPSN
jgi:hypothetical protein